MRISKKLSVQPEILDMKEIEYPVTLKAIDETERLNPSISVSVFGYETNVYPLRVSTHRVGRATINPLLISDGDKKHYCRIKNMSSLLSSQQSCKNYELYHGLNRFQESFNIYKGGA